MRPRTLEAFITRNETDLNKATTQSPHSHIRGIHGPHLNPNIIIEPADKGSTVIIMNVQDYIEEAESQSSNPEYYMEVPSNRTKSHKDYIDITIDEVYDNKQIGKKCQKFLKTGGQRTPLFYTLPKIHKNKLPPPGRPILSANDCSTEKISALVDHFLHPIVEKTMSHIKDTTHFLNVLSRYKNLPPETLIVTLDIGSLYTNIPNEKGITAVRDFLQKHRTAQDTSSND